MDKKSFVFYKDWRDAIKDLPDDVRLELYDCIMEYAFTGKIEGLKPMTSIAFNFIKPMIDRDAEKYMSITERNKSNGARGGRPKKETKNNPPKPQKPTGFSGNPKNLDNVNVNDNTSPIIPQQGETVATAPDESEETRNKGKTDSPLSKIEEEFERFRKAYPGNKRGHKTEFENFKKKHSDYQTAVYLLYPALMKLNEWKSQKRQLGQFVPEYANLQTWINQRRWEEEFEKIEENNETTQKQTKRYDDGDFLQ